MILLNALMQTLRDGVLPRLGVVAGLLTLVVLPTAAQAQQERVPSLRALRIQSALSLDGFLSEDYWQQADITSDFRQYEPLEGQPATERTEVRTMYDEKNLYIGVRCYDSEPEKIIAQKLERDSGVRDDDCFLLVLDTYHDHRNAFYFATNPNGVEEDGLVTDEQRFFNRDWDGVWQVKARITKEGWSAEFAIPFWTLRFPKAPVQTWGLNFSRIIKRKNEEVNWASWTRLNGGFHRISKAGHLVGLEGLAPGRNLQIKPFALTRGTQDTAGPSHLVTRGDLDSGLDVKYGLASNLTLDLTVNTDFAQVEADVQQINLTRFSLFYPEKREFFLENAGLFDFGVETFGGPPRLLLFFSRRIGIEGGQNIPILAGGRVTGKVGRYNIGLLDIASDRKGEVARAHFSVLRIKRDLFQRSYLGLIATNRADVGERENRTFGLDGSLWLSNELELKALWARAQDLGRRNAREAGRIALDFTRNHWGWFAEHLLIDNGFDPGIGFVHRTNLRRSFAVFRVSPQPNGRLLRRTNIFNSYTYLTTVHGRVQDRAYEFRVNNQLDSGDQVNFGYEWNFERLDQPFPLRSEVRLPTGDFRTNRYSLGFEASKKRRIAGEMEYSWGGFYDGNQQTWEIQGELKPSAHFSMELGYRHDDLRLREGAFKTNLFSLRINWALSTRLFTNALIQYNSDTRQVSLNYRLDFIHSPGSDLFVVVNGTWLRRPQADLITMNRALVVKWTQLLHF